MQSLFLLFCMIMIQCMLKLHRLLKPIGPKHKTYLTCNLGQTLFAGETQTSQAVHRIKLLFRKFWVLLSSVGRELGSRATWQPGYTAPDTSGSCPSKPGQNSMVGASWEGEGCLVKLSQGDMDRINRPLGLHSNVQLPQWTLTPTNKFSSFKRNQLLLSPPPTRTSNGKKKLTQFRFPRGS